MRGAHPIEMLEIFCKEAAALQTSSFKPYGVGEMRKTPSRGGIGQEKPTYTAPNPPVAAANPGLVESQKMLPPPSVR